MRARLLPGLSCTVVLVALVLALPAWLSGGCDFSFNWYCSGCAKIGARTTGTIGGFSTEAACERARAEWLRSNRDVGGGGNTSGSCERHGICEEPSPKATPPPSRPSSNDTRTLIPPREPPKTPDNTEATRAEAERKKAEEENRQKQLEFERGKQEAINKLKGVSPSELPLKGADTIKDLRTPLLGVRGVGDTGIKNIPPDAQVRDVSTAWKQIHCAAEIAGYAIAAADKTSGSIDLNEVRYLASQSLQALNGERLGVQCSEAPPMPKATSTRGLDASGVRARYEPMLRGVVQQAVAIDSANQKIEEQKAKATAANHVVSQAGSGAKADADATGRAAAEQKADQAQEQQRINDIYEKQKQNESAMAEALAALRAAQQLINQMNAQKAAASRALTRYQQLNNRVLATGDPGPAAVQSPSTR